MKFIFTYFLLFFVFFSCRAESGTDDVFVSESDTLNLATFNVRIQTTADTQERSWNNRKNHVARLINNYRFDIVGVQELVDISQEKDLRNLLPSYSVFSSGRDDTQGRSGERLAIFYHTKRFEKLDGGFFFLSETPDRASRGWDAALNRICQWVHLRDRVTLQKFYFFNTHFDHRGVLARSQSALLLQSKIKEIAGSAPVVLVGDINASPYEAAVYNTLSATWADAKRKSPLVEGFAGTFNAWNVNATHFDENLRIDYIFVSTHFDVFKYRNINIKYVPETFPSDHFPVQAYVRIK